MSDRYQVQFVWDGQIRFGIVERFSDDAKKAAAEGKLVIEDSITPERYVVADDGDVVDIPLSMEGLHLNPETGQFEGGDEYHQHVQKAYNEARKLSDGLPEGLVVGKLFSMPVADGRAWYVVTKVNKKTCRVEWRGYCMDRYVDHWLGYGGTFDAAKIRAYIESEEGLSKLFKKGTA